MRLAGMSRASMQWCLLVAVLMCVSSSLAFRTTVVEDAASSHHGRSLLQQEALSNSNGCLDTIPKCETGACATRNVRGVARWVCLRCLSNYEAVVDDSGQDNIIQCVCGPTTYENSTDATSCTRCPTNSYCPGGDRVESPTSRGALAECGPGLITRNTGARSATDCVAPAGYAMTSPTAATACGPSEYAPQFNRLKTCLKCQGGLEEEVPSTFTDGERSTKRAVCKVPPGRYMSQGLVRICPQGFYRANYADFDAEVAQKCVACNQGITSNGPGTQSAAECNRVLPGYGVDSIPEVSAADGVPALFVNDTTGLPAASMCELGFYSAGGYCAACPSGTVTRIRGAQAIEECVVPPGYWLPASGAMTQCAAGSFRESWVMFSGSKATTCTLCGDNILGEPRDMDENPLAANGSTVASTSASCYIEAGQGMIAQGKNTFRGLTCPVNSYGVSGRVYGWFAAPCKPCPRNMITDITGATSSSDCINPAGFGYSSEGSSRCSPGFYSSKGSLKPCKKCPEGRTTADEPQLQQYLTHCNVAPGWGVVAADPVNGDIFSPTLPVVDEMALVSLDVLQCPTGYYGGGQSLGATCTKCPEGSTTTDPGSTNVQDCNVCLPGLGKADSMAPCLPCAYGFWQPGGLAECQPCPTTTFYPPVDGVGDKHTSTGMTFSEGATGEEWCVPVHSQLSPEAGQAYFSPEFAEDTDLRSFFTSTDIASVDDCLAQCSTDFCCLAQFNAATNTCQYVQLSPAGATDVRTQLFYKLPPSAMSAASSVKQGAGASAADAAAAAAAGDGQAEASTVRSRWTNAPRLPRVKAGTKSTFAVSRKQQTSSGSSQVVAASSFDTRAQTLSSALYARCSIPVTEAAAWEKVGSQLTLDARTFSRGPDVWLNVTDLQTCQQLCDNSNTCWGGLYRDGQCLFRSGIDALRTRAFFALPAPGSVPDFVTPTGNAFYYTFTSGSGAPVELSPDILYAALLQALQEVSSFSEDVQADIWEPGPPDGETQGQEFGFTFIDGFGEELQSDLLQGLFVGNASTTALVARNLVELVMGSGGEDQKEILFSGLLIVSSNGAQQPASASDTPLLIDGCVLVPDYCGADQSNSCTLNKCQCQAGWDGWRCTEASGGLP